VIYGSQALTLQQATKRCCCRSVGQHTPQPLHPTRKAASFMSATATDTPHSALVACRCLMAEPAQGAAERAAPALPQGRQGAARAGAAAVQRRHLRPHWHQQGEPPPTLPLPPVQRRHCCVLRRSRSAPSNCRRRPFRRAAVVCHTCAWRHGPYADAPQCSVHMVIAQMPRSPVPPPPLLMPSLHCCAVFRSVNNTQIVGQPLGGTHQGP
jgi:hypothetical protein